MLIRREQPGSELIDLLDRVLDKGVTVEASARIRVSANTLQKMGAHFVVESVETHKVQQGVIRTAGEPRKPRPVLVFRPAGQR